MLGVPHDRVLPAQQSWLTGRLRGRMRLDPLGMVRRAPPMNHLNYDFDASQGDDAEVTLDRAANVLLMEPADYDDYVHGRPYRYGGGYATRSPVRLAIPRD